MENKELRTINQENPKYQIFISEALIQFFSPKKQPIQKKQTKDNEQNSKILKDLIKNFTSSFEDEVEEYLDTQEKFESITASANIDDKSKTLNANSISQGEKKHIGNISKYSDLTHEAEALLSEATTIIDNLLEKAEGNEEIAKDLLDTAHMSFGLLEKNLSSLEKRIKQKQQEWTQHLHHNLVDTIWSPLETRVKLIKGQFIKFQDIQKYLPFEYQNEKKLSLRNHLHYDYEKILNFGEKEESISELLSEPFGNDFLSFNYYGLNQIRLDPYERTIFAATQFIMGMPFYLEKAKTSLNVENETYKNITNYVANELHDHIKNFSKNKSTNSEHLIWNQFMIWLNKTVNENKDTSNPFINHLKELFGVKNQPIIDYSSIIDNKEDATYEEKRNFYFYMYQDLLNTYETSQKNQDEKLLSWLSTWSNETFLQDYRKAMLNTEKDIDNAYNNLIIDVPTIDKHIQDLEKFEKKNGVLNLKKIDYLIGATSTALTKFFNSKKENNFSCLVIFKSFFYKETKDLEFSIDKKIEKTIIEKEINPAKNKLEKNTAMRF